jgi:hypothetical protein
VYVSFGLSHDHANDDPCGLLLELLDDAAVQVALERLFRRTGQGTQACGMKQPYCC